MPTISVRPICPAAAALVKNFEGCYFKAYLDPDAIWTAGYGHTGPDVVEGTVCDQAQADTWLISDMKSAALAVQKFCKVPLNDNQFGALVSFTFNVGSGNFQKSTLVANLNRGWYDQVPAQLARWNRSGGEPQPGLSRRRAAEGSLWNTPVSSEDENGQEDA